MSADLDPLDLAVLAARQRVLAEIRRRTGPTTRIGLAAHVFRGRPLMYRMTTREGTVVIDESDTHIIGCQILDVTNTAVHVGAPVGSTPVGNVLVADCLISGKPYVPPAPEPEPLGRWARLRAAWRETP